MSMNGLHHAPTYYAATMASAQRWPRLEGDVRADVCVIGGGFTGLAAALTLAERGSIVRLLEARAIGWGASGRNGGQIHTGLRHPQRDLEREYGEESARAMWRLAERGRELLEERVARHAIACDLKPGLLLAAWSRRDVAQLKDHVEHLSSRYGYRHLRFLPKDAVAEIVATTRYHGAVLDAGGGHLHPLNYALGLAEAANGQGAHLHEDSKAIAIERGAQIRVRTAAGTVQCRALILAGDSYLGHLVPELQSRLFPINVYVAATEPLGEARARALIRDDIAVADTKYVVDYYRLTPDHRLLFGGGESYWPGDPADVAGLVRRPMLHVFPQLRDTRLDYTWGGLVGVTLNRMMHAGRLAPNILFTQGYSGQGVMLAGLMGTLMGEALTGKPEGFELMAQVPIPAFPGGAWLRAPLQAMAMSFYALRDRLGI
ncbi:MAG: FAD-binding oxidoreductase [Alphaproteobacteria bacterium]|nr:FAD-binding oxidoreductase [Alphaproteobacteria bacterium]